MAAQRHPQAESMKAAEPHTIALSRGDWRFIAESDILTVTFGEPKDFRTSRVFLTQRFGATPRTGTGGDSETILDQAKIQTTANDLSIGIYDRPNINQLLRWAADHPANGLLVKLLEAGVPQAGLPMGSARTPQPDPKHSIAGPIGELFDRYRTPYDDLPPPGKSR